MTEGSKLRLVVWNAGGTRCGAPLAQLREILPALAVAPLPGTPPAIRGVASVRGTVLTVVDGRTVLGLPDDSAPAATILVRAGPRTIGLAVDDVEDLVTVREAELSAPGRSGATPGWLVRVDDGAPVRLLDLEGLLQPLFPA